jgi:tetratricopeptide (TPR) repeat protein
MWLQRLESDHDNLRAALDWAGETGDSETELAVAGGLWRFWRTRGHLSEGRRRLGEALDRAGEALPELRALALKGAAILADRQGAYGEARRLAEVSLGLYRAIGDERDTAYALATLGTVAASSERFEESEEFFEEALQLARGVDDVEVLALALANLGDLALSRGDYRRAQALSAESLGLDRQRGDIEGEAISLFNVGLASLELGAPEEGEAALGKSLKLFHQLGNSEGIAYCLEALAAAACSRNYGTHSARLLAAAESLRRTLGISLRPAELELHERTLARLCVICDPDAIDTASEEGRTLTVDQAVDLAQSRDFPRDSGGER